MKCLPSPTFVASPGGPCFDQSSVLALRPGIVPSLMSSLKIYQPSFLFFLFLLLASLAENTFLFVCTHHVKEGIE